MILGDWRTRTINEQVLGSCYQQLSHDVARDRDLPARDLKVYVWLRSFPSGWRFTRAQCAEGTGYSTPTVQLALRSLEARGLLIHHDRQRFEEFELVACRPDSEWCKQSRGEVRKKARSMRLKNGRQRDNADTGRGAAVQTAVGADPVGNWRDIPLPEEPWDDTPEPPPVDETDLKKFNAEGKKFLPHSNTKSKNNPPTHLTVSSPPQGEQPETPAKASKKRSRRERAQRLPEGWLPSQKSVDQIKRMFPSLDLRMEHAKFSNYWAAAGGQSARKLDWDAAWRNWMMKAAEMARIPAQAPVVVDQAQEALFGPQVLPSGGVQRSIPAQGGGSSLDEKANGYLELGRRLWEQEVAKERASSASPALNPSDPSKYTSGEVESLKTPEINPFDWMGGECR